MFFEKYLATYTSKCFVRFAPNSGAVKKCKSAEVADENWLTV